MIRLPSPAWLALALAACLAVAVLNAGPLFYFDTGGYVAQGLSALRRLGFPPPDFGQAGGGSLFGGPDGVVDGSRSAVFAIVLGLFAWARALGDMAILNSALVIVAVWLPLRVAAREGWLAARPAQGASIAILVAAFGSLPFYIAYLMPDILAPVLILAMATMAVFGREMRLGEIVLALALAGFAVVSHLSHLAIAGLMLPVGAAAALLVAIRRWWLVVLMLALVPLVGVVEQKAFRVAAREMAQSDVVIKPFITARLIQDGPGLRYLERHCPDPAIPTCALFQALSRSDDPYRLTASHIIFETSQRLGSFKLMSPEDQRRVADAQSDFFKAVLREAPLATTAAILGNMLRQTVMFSVDMTIPDQLVLTANDELSGLPPGELHLGRLSQDRSWIAPLTAAQAGLYAVSLAVLVWLVFGARGISRPLRVFAAMLVAGILVNALVCGGISQPADRYGARVIWLLPLATTILVLAKRRPEETA